MTNVLSRLLLPLLAMPFAVSTPPAIAADNEVDVELVVSVDVSRPMDRDEAEVARGGYVAAFRDPDVITAILKGSLGGFRVVEVPVSYYPRIGTSKISGTIKGTVGAGWFILSLIVRYYFRHSEVRT